MNEDRIRRYFEDAPDPLIIANGAFVLWNFVDNLPRADDRLWELRFSLKTRTFHAVLFRNTDNTWNSPSIWLPAKFTNVLRSMLTAQDLAAATRAALTGQE